MSRIFINYRRQDSEGYVGRLYDHLVQQFRPEDIFMDVASIEPGVDFVDALENAVAACDVFIAMIGPHWLEVTDDSGRRRLEQWNDFVRLEIASALKQNKRVIPVLVGRAAMPAPDLLPDDIAPLSRRNAIELRHQDFAHDVAALMSVIKNVLPTHPAFKPSADPAIAEQKAAKLRVIHADLMNATTSPLYDFRVQNSGFPVMGEGHPDANIVFIGESPGKTEAAEGRPFCGPSGDVLDEMLRGIRLSRDDVYLTNILWDRPPDNRQPTTDEIAFYAVFVDRLLDVVRPAVIVTLGRFAMQYILKKYDLPQKRGKISQLHGQLLKAQVPYGEIYIVPLFHPAVVLYTASQKDVLREDFEKLRMFV